MAPGKNPISIERENLEAHVELCAERYQQLEEKISELDTKMQTLTTSMTEIRISLDKSFNATNVNFNNRLLAISASIIGVLSTTLLGLILHNLK